MAVWGVVNSITFNLVKLPVDEAPYDVPEYQSETYRTEKERALSKIVLFVSRFVFDD